MKSLLLVLLFFGVVFTSCASSLISDDLEKNTSYKLKQEEIDLGISLVPKKFSREHHKLFNRYTKIVAPNGKSIHFFIQDELTIEQIVRARSVMKHYLTDYKGSLYGSNKKLVANSMADNDATILLLNGSDENEDIGVMGQPLYKNEIQVEGGEWYINQEYRHRDATFEEILHLVHDTGIIQSGNGFLLEFQKEIKKAQNYALKNKIWGMGEDEWIEELSEEGSLTQEYLASLIDAYYGLWGAWDDDKTSSMWGIYTPRNRDEIKTEDKLGQELLNNKFFHPYLAYNARIHKNFEGTFYLKFDKNIPYTYHSRYLKDITLTGNKNTNVVVNEMDNFISGNGGINTVIFSGIFENYEIKKEKNSIIVLDKTKKDGKNTLKNIEKIQFKNKILDTSML